MCGQNLRQDHTHVQTQYFWIMHRLVRKGVAEQDEM